LPSYYSQNGSKWNTELYLFNSTCFLHIYCSKL
jgi:hypothetical protein